MASADAGRAQVVGRWSASGTFTDGYSANPFLSAGDDTGSGYAELSFSPTYLLLEPAASTALSANYRRTEYYRRYDGTSGYGANISHNRSLDARTSLGINLNFDSSIQGERESFFAPPLFEPPETPGETPIPDPGDPDAGAPPVPQEPIDPALIGSRDRRDFLSVSANLSSSPSPFDSYSVNLRANRSFYKSPNSFDYRSFGETFSYSRRLSDRMDVGAQLSVDRTDYLGGRGSDATSVQPQLTFGVRLSPSWNLDAALGASFIDSEGPIGNRTSISGNFSLCRIDPRSSLCLSIDRSAGASGVGNVGEQSSVVLNYTNRIGPRDSISAVVAYNRSDELEILASDPEYLSTTVSWNSQANERLSAGASLSFRQTYGSLRTASADVNGQVYLRMSFGR